MPDTFSFEEATTPEKFSFEDATIKEPETKLPERFSLDQDLSTPESYIKSMRRPAPYNGVEGLTRATEFSEPSPIQVQSVIEKVSNIARAIPADVAAGLSLLKKPDNQPASLLPNPVASYRAIKGNLDSAADASGNIVAAVNDEPLPIDEQLKLAAQADKEEGNFPTAATIGKISQGLAGTAPLAVVGFAPATIQKLVALGFSADMISKAPEIATGLGEELGKPPEERDPDRLSSLVSDAIQTGVFAPLAGLHGSTVLRKLKADKFETPKIEVPDIKAPEIVAPEITAKSDATLSENLPAQEKETGITPKEDASTPETMQEMVGMGGAVPSEFENNPKTPTSIKNAQVDVERQQRGLPAAVEPVKRTFGKVWDDAMATIDKNPEIQEDLIVELRDKPRSLSDTEDAMLLQKQIELQNEYGKATRDLAQAYDDGRIDDVANQKFRVEELLTQLQQIYDINKKAGTEQGRGLAARRMMAYEDFSLAKMMVEKRAAKGGQPLTESEAKEIQSLQKKIEDTQKAYDKYVSDTESKIAKMDIDAAFARIEAEKANPKYHPRIIQIAENFASYMDKKGDDALARIRKKLGRTNVGVDPTILSDAAIVGAAKLTRGLTEFAKWSDSMIEDLGEFVRPYLKDIYDSSHKSFESESERLSKRIGRNDAESVKKSLQPIGERINQRSNEIKNKVAEGKIEDITPQVQQLARLFRESGITDREKMVDALHEKMKEIIPDITRQETQNAFSGYGRFKQLTKDEISVSLREMRGELQQIAKLEDMAASKPPLKTGTERRTPNAEERRLIKEVNDAKNKFQIPISDPNTQLKSALDTLKTTLRNRIQDYQDRLSNKDFAARPRRRIVLDKEALNLKFQNEQAKKSFWEGMIEDRLANRNIPMKIFQGVGEGINASRAVMTAFDLSAVLRQGGMITLAHPVRSAKVFPDMMRAFASENGRYRVEQQIAGRDNFPLYRESGLFLSEHNQKLSQMEEQYMSRWAKKIPGVAASERAYTTFLNKLRADSFDAMARTLGRDGQITPSEAKVISNFINVSTGRGNLPNFERALVGANTLFFAPRYVASRFQALLGEPIYHGLLTGKIPLAESARARKLVVKEYARFLAGIGIIYGLASMAGAKVETDPRSSEFGKIHVGNTRVDLLTGIAQNTVLLSRLASGQSKTSKGKIVPIVGDKVPYGGETSTKVLWDFTRKKFAPIPGALISLREGRDVIGNKVTLGSTAKNLLIPMSTSEIFASMKEAGVPAGTALGLLTIFGANVQNYDEKKKRK